jgi:hypothetical protein
LASAWSFWQQIDREHLRRCDEVVVLMLDGWDRSVGVREEVCIARELGKPVRFLDPANPDPSVTTVRCLLVHPLLSGASVAKQGRQHLPQ